MAERTAPVAETGTPLDLDAIRARCEAAWPGPWFVESHEVMDATRGRTIVLRGESEQDDADAAFIACARSDVPALVAEVERLRRGLRQLWEGDYPAEAGDAETWAKELLDDPTAVDWAME